MTDFDFSPFPLFLQVEGQFSVFELSTVRKRFRPSIIPDAKFYLLPPPFRPVDNFSFRLWWRRGFGEFFGEGLRLLDTL